MVPELRHEQQLKPGLETKRTLAGSTADAPIQHHRMANRKQGSEVPCSSCYETERKMAGLGWRYMGRSLLHAVPWRALVSALVLPC